MTKRNLDHLPDMYGFQAATNMYEGNKVFGRRGAEVNIYLYHQYETLPTHFNINIYSYPTQFKYRIIKKCENYTFFNTISGVSITKEILSLDLKLNIQKNVFIFYGWPSQTLEKIYCDSIFKYVVIPYHLYILTRLKWNIIII
jgi:hypothetical protein